MRDEMQPFFNFMNVIFLKYIDYLLRKCLRIFIFSKSLKLVADSNLL